MGSANFFFCPQSKRLTFGIVWINHLVVVIVVDVLPSLTCWPVERTLRTCHKFWKETCVHHLVSLAYHVTNDRDCNFRTIFEKQFFRQGETSAHIQPHPSAPWRGEEDKSRSHPATLLDPGRCWCLPTKPEAKNQPATSCEIPSHRHTYAYVGYVYGKESVGPPRTIYGTVHDGFQHVEAPECLEPDGVCAEEFSIRSQ